MEEAKNKTKEICELKDKLVCGLKEQMNRGLHSVNTEEAGQVTDMIKDLAEAEEKIWKACYYKKIVEAMHEEKEEEELMMKLAADGDEDGMMGYPHGRRGRMGYDNWRYSSGRYAPKGHGHFSGYTPMGDMVDPWMMGYGDGSSRSSDGQNGSNYGNSSRGSGSGSSGGSRMGYTPSERGHRYDAYSKARMGFHESQDAKSKEHMDSAAKEYLVDMTEGIREVWRDADPAMRKEIKNKFAALMSEMG